MGGLRESHWVAPLWQFELPLWGISSGFPWASHFDLAGSQPLFGLSQDPRVHTRLLAKMDSAAKGLWGGQGTPWHHSSLTFKEPFCASVVREVSRLQEREIRALGRAQLSPLTALLFLSWSFSPHGMNESPVSLPWARGWVGVEGIYLLPMSIAWYIESLLHSSTRLQQAADFLFSVDSGMAEQLRVVASTHQTISSKPRWVANLDGICEFFFFKHLLN